MGDRRVVVTGASRGLGLEFVRQCLERGDQVAALAREVDGEILRRLQQGSGERLLALPCDVTDEHAMAAAAAAVAQRWQTVDLVIANAGVAGATGEGLGQLQWDDVRRTFEVNVIGAVRTVRAFLPGLRGGRDPVAALITSRMGSIDDNTSGGWWSYRISKAALNMAGRNLAHDLRPAGVTVLMLHPGWVRTDMGGDQAPLSPRESVAGMLAVLERATLADTGSFVDRDGAPVPW